MTGRMSRRNFLKTAALVVPATAIGGCSLHNTNEHPTRNARVFFSAEETAFIDAATQRLIPADKLGPGANEAGITDFLDRQLAGAFGRAERWYMQGPWPTGTDQQGFQNQLTPAQIYRSAIADIDQHCEDRYHKPFATLEAAQQDEILHALEGGKIKLRHSPANTFFALLWQNTQEAFLADPVYGGNRDFAGWKLIGFPGPRYNYVAEIEKYGQPYKQPFVSIGGPHFDAAQEG
jgi:gluconate 2-dehydrogenase gamma chain